MAREPVAQYDGMTVEQTAEHREKMAEQKRQRTAAARAALAVKHAKKIQLLGWKAVDLNSPGAVAVKEWREDLMQTLGGEDNLTPQKAALVNAASLTMLIIARLDDLILVSSGPLVNSQTFELLPFLMQREFLVDGLTRRLKALGLERVQPKRITDLSTFAAEMKARERDEDEEPEVINGTAEVTDDIGV